MPKPKIEARAQLNELLIAAGRLIQGDKAPSFGTGTGTGEVKRNLSMIDEPEAIMATNITCVTRLRSAILHPFEAVRTRVTIKEPANALPRSSSTKPTAVSASAASPTAA